MTLTKKFSQFNGPSPIASTDIVVGLRDGDNWQFTGVGSGGGGGGVTETITQPGQTFSAGKWLRIDTGTELYTLAQADTTADAEVIGIVISSNIPAGTFVLQQSGYINTSQAVVSGLTTGVPQFLSSSSPGDMQPMDVTADGQISRPLFVPDSPTSGWVIPYRGIITDGGPNTGTGGSGTASDSNIITVTQNMHGFTVGSVLYVITPVGGQATYALAQANSFATSQAVGVVIQVLNTNEFMIQFSGYNLQTGGVGGITVDDMGMPVIASTVYYLSAIDAGRVTSVNPAAAGTFSRPIFVSERTNLTSSLYAGWILPQRPLDESPAGVPGGGTGSSSFTPNSVIGAGTTSTSPLISIGPGTAGQVLTSNGPLLPPTFKNSGGGSGVIQIVPFYTSTIYNLYAATASNWTAIVSSLSSAPYPPIFSISITPTSASSQIRIYANVSLAWIQTGMYLSVIRSPVISMGAAPTITGGVLVGSSSTTVVHSSQAFPFIIDVLDSPATTSTLNYIVAYAQNPPGGLYQLNNSAEIITLPPFGAILQTSCIIAEEIG